MKENGMFILSMIALVGVFLIVGVLTRGADDDNPDRDNVWMTLMRGLAVVGGILAALLPIAGIIILIVDAFS